MENSPLFADEQGVLRKSRGYVGMASLTFGDTKIAGGFGVTELKTTATEAEPFATLTIPKRQSGISAGVYQGFYQTFTVALEFFRGMYEWYDTLEPTSGQRVSHKQAVNFVNAGVTLMF
jgi:hypothetical protein